MPSLACVPPAGPGSEPVVFVGRTEGRIVPARGPTDFGWVAPSCDALHPLRLWQPCLHLLCWSLHHAAAHACSTLTGPSAACPCRWDPIFEVTEAVGRGETYAEMNKDVKNGISHRYRSLDKLRAYLLGGHAAAGAAAAAAAGGVAQ